VKLIAKLLASIALLPVCVLACMAIEALVTTFIYAIPWQAPVWWIVGALVMALVMWGSLLWAMWSGKPKPFVGDLCPHGLPILGPRCPHCTREWVKGMKSDSSKG